MSYQENSLTYTFLQPIIWGNWRRVCRPSASQRTAFSNRTAINDRRPVKVKLQYNLTRKSGQKVKQKLENIVFGLPHFGGNVAVKITSSVAIDRARSVFWFNYYYFICFLLLFT